MAFKSYSFRYADRTAFFNAVCAALINMGWELHDSVSSTVKVYKSNGESGNEPYGYIWIDNNASSYIEFIPYQYWDASAHTGYRAAYNAGGTSYRRLSAFTTSYDAMIVGDKNLVFVDCNANSTGNASYCIGFGHIPGRFYTPKTTLTAGATSGSGAILTVASTTGFGVGSYFQIVGTTEGCDLLTVTEVTDSTHLKVSNLPRNYASGAYLGIPGSVFGWIKGAGSYFYPCCHYGDSGTTVGTNYYGMYALTSGLYDTEGFSKKLILSPFIFYTANAAHIGYISKYILFTSATTTWDVQICNDDGSIPTSSTATSATSTTLSDTAKSWTVDALIGKYVIIVSGTGAGQVRKITDNDSTSLTVAEWFTTPDGTSDYKICDTVYRCIQNALYSGGYHAFLIDETVVPS